MGKWNEVEEKLIKAHKLIEDDLEENGAYDNLKDILESVSKEQAKTLKGECLGLYYLVFGEYCYYANEMKQAIKNLKRSADLLTGNNKGEALSYLGRCYYENNDSKKAIRLLSKALEFIKDKKIRVETITCLSSSYMDIDDYNQSLKNSLKVIELAEDENGLLKEIYYSSIVDVYTCHWKLGNLKEADKYIQQLIRTKNVPDWVLKSAYTRLGHRTFEEGKFNEALEYYQEALNKAGDKDNKNDLKEMIEKCKHKISENKEK